jgi:hypothetical protein
MTRSFGRPEPAEKDKPGEELPTPVLHVGEVHAELRLTVSEETLRDLGSQIASMFANAAKQGFEHGLAAAMEQLEADDAGTGGEPESRRRGTQLDLSNMSAGELHLSEKDIERLGRAR